MGEWGGMIKSIRQPIHAHPIIFTHHHLPILVRSNRSPEFLWLFILAAASHHLCHWEMRGHPMRDESSSFVLA